MKNDNSGKKPLFPEEKGEKTLVDPYGRKVTGLRISITDRCNLSRITSYNVCYTKLLRSF